MRTIATQVNGTGTQIATGGLRIKRISVVGDAGLIINFYDWVDGGGHVPQVAHGSFTERVAGTTTRTSTSTDCSGTEVTTSYPGVTTTPTTVASGNTAIQPFHSVICPNSDNAVDVTCAAGVFAKVTTSATVNVVLEVEPTF